MHRNIFRKTTSIEDKASTHKNSGENTDNSKTKRKTGIKRSHIKFKNYLAKFSELHIMGSQLMEKITSHNQKNLYHMKTQSIRLICW